MNDKIFKLAIVGSSSAPDSAYDFVKDTIKKFIVLTPQVEIVSGCANGIDTMAEKVASELGLKSSGDRFKPKVKDWLAVGGFRERNMKIVEYADMVISIAMPYTNDECYHCHSKTHDRTGGCWTVKHAKEKGKPTAVVIIPQVFLK